MFEALAVAVAEAADGNSAADLGPFESIAAAAAGTIAVLLDDTAPGFVPD